jgi:hypothetical protein
MISNHRTALRVMPAARLESVLAGHFGEFVGEPGSHSRCECLARRQVGSDRCTRQAGGSGLDGQNTMQISREEMLSLIRDRFGDREAQHAADDLPDQIDHEQHADLLRKYHLTPKDFLQRFGGLGER